MDNQEYFQPPRKQKSNFGKGVLVGALASLLTVTLAAGGLWLGINAGLRKKSSSKQEESSKEAISEKSVEKKSGDCGFEIVKSRKLCGKVGLTEGDEVCLVAKNR